MKKGKVFVVVSMRNLKVLLVDKYTGVGSPERRNNRVSVKMQDYIYSCQSNILVPEEVSTGGVQGLYVGVS